MGIYYQPPAPHMGRQQPLEPRKLPPALALVGTPPFAIPGKRAGTREFFLCVLPAWQPDLNRPFVGGRQPLARNYLNPALETVPNPTFSHPTRRPGTREFFGSVLPSWLPDLSRPFTGGCQPLDNRNLNAALETVPDPPFAHPMRQDDSVEFWVIRQSWESEFRLPPRQVFSLPQVVVAVNDPPFGMPPGWLTLVVRSWQPPDPQPQRDYPIQLLSVDNPPGQQPGAEWLAIVQQAWQPGPPAPQRNIPSQLQSVDDPPRTTNTLLQQIVRSWQPPDPLPQRELPSQILSVDTPPGQQPGAAWLSILQQAWQPGPPLPLRPTVCIPLETPAATDDPPFSSRHETLQLILSWWDPGPWATQYAPKIFESGPSVPVIPPATINYQGDGKKKRKKRRNLTYELFAAMERTIWTELTGPVVVEAPARSAQVVAPVVDLSKGYDAALDQLLATAGEYEDLSRRVGVLRTDISAYQTRQRQAIEEDDEDTWLLM